MRKKAFASVLGVGVVVPMLASAQISSLGTLGGAGSFANGVSADGAVVVGWSDLPGNGPYHAFRWANGVMTDLGTLGGDSSSARGVSSDGSVVVGEAYTATNGFRAFRWANNLMTDLGTLGGTFSLATGVSADGSVVVGLADTVGNASWHAFRWANSIMADLGTLGGTHSVALAVSSDGSVIVGSSLRIGNAGFHAFRWENNVMADLGTLGGFESDATGVSANGQVVVGESDMPDNVSEHAFRWSGNVMADLGTLGGTSSGAAGVSADGSVVVGSSHPTGDAALRAFRWTQATGMQSVEDWLRAAGVTVAADVTQSANATNSDGSVVVGQLQDGSAFIARVNSVGSGLVTLADVQQSLGGIAHGGGMLLRTAGTVLNGAHSRPLARRVESGRNTFWLAGDWGRDDHGARDGDLGLAEAGFGRNFGPVQVNVSLGQTWAKQNEVLRGHVQAGGAYVLAEALIPVSGKLWATLGSYGHQGKADLRRGYLNAGTPDRSTGHADADTWGLRARLDLDKAYRFVGVDVSPYIDLTHFVSKLGGYTERGGGFPARFDARKEKATELRLGINASKPVSDGINAVGTLEGTHNFEKTGARTSGEVIGLFGFDLDGTKSQRRWLRAGAGVEGKIAGGTGSLMLNATTKSESLSYWLAANWQMAF